MDVRKYLHSKGYQWKEVSRSSGKWAVMNCLFCDDTKQKFAIHLENGTYKCMRENSCGVSGSFYELQMKLGDTPLKTDNNHKYISEKKEYDKPKVNSFGLDEIGFNFFQSRKIKESTLKQFGITQKKDWIAFNYFKNGEIVNVKYRYIKEKKFYKEKNGEPTLYNMDNIKSDTLYTVEGEIDCLSLYEYGISGTSIPSGTNDLTWIENQWEWLQQFQKIFLIMDNDKAGQSAVREIVNRLGKWRCFNVQLPKKDLNECLVDGIEQEIIYRCFANAQEFNFNKLKSIDEFREDIIDVFTNKDRLNGVKIKYEKFNAIIRGWRESEVSVWTGRNSSGKTTFLNEIIIDLCSNKQRCCIASLELMPKRLLRWMLIQLTSNEFLIGNDLENAIKWFSGKLWLYDSTQNIKKDILIDAFEFAARKYGCKHFFIDSLMKIDLDSKYIYEEQKKFMNELSRFAKEFKCHIHLVAHPRKSASDDDKPGKSDIAGTGDITNLADNVFSFFRFSEEQKTKSVESGKPISDNILYVKKNREWGDERSVKFIFNTKTKNFKEF